MPSRCYRRHHYPHSGRRAYLVRSCRRILHDLVNPLTERLRDVAVLSSQHCCSQCRQYFEANMSDLADPGSHYTRPVGELAIRVGSEDATSVLRASV